ncbi:MAG TPA: endonuclease/exonuclease/phosphatase family protein [Beijerinckiaceae bacterium]
MIISDYFFVVLGALGVLGTVLPLAPSGKPIFRVWDFPRSQIAAVLALAAAAALIRFEIDRPLAAVYVATLLSSLAWQAAQIMPYTPLYKRQARPERSGRDGPHVRLLASNVLMENRDSARLLSLIEEVRPDVVLLVETDDWWDAKLEPLTAQFPYAVRHPQPNCYGMHLFSRLELVDPEIRFLVDEGVPSITTRLKLKSGDMVHLYGVHPQPPPFVDTEERDAELLIVAKEIAAQKRVAIVAGDLNDVAWSFSTRRFQKVSGLVDPRVGRGLYNTFDARRPWFARWPLDHVFFSPSFRLGEMCVMRDIGSDHFPFFVALRYAPEEPEGEPPDAESADHEAAEETIEVGLEKASRSPGP